MLKPAEADKELRLELSPDQSYRKCAGVPAVYSFLENVEKVSWAGIIQTGIFLRNHAPQSNKSGSHSEAERHVEL